MGEANNNGNIITRYLRERQRSELVRGFEKACETAEAETDNLIKVAEATLKLVDRLSNTQERLQRRITSATDMVDKDRDDLASTSNDVGWIM